MGRHKKWANTPDNPWRNYQRISEAQKSMKQFRRFMVIIEMTLMRAKMPHKNVRVELEMKILKIRKLALGADSLTRERLEALARELEEKLRQIDEIVTGLPKLIAEAC